MLRCLRIISDSQPKQISPQSRRESAHISNTRHAASPLLLMFLFGFFFSSLIFFLFTFRALPLFFFLFFSLLRVALYVWMCIWDDCIYLFSFSFFSRILWQSHGWIASILSRQNYGWAGVFVCEREIERKREKVK